MSIYRPKCVNKFSLEVMKTKIESILLSAGKSSRMGTEKALLEIDGKKLISIILEKMLSFSKKVYIILGDNFENVQQVVKNEKFPLDKIEFIFNEKHHLGMFSSILKGFSVTTGKHPVMLQMIDQPFVPLAIYKKLIDFLDEDHFIFQPSCEINRKKRAGHPILFSPYFKELILKNQDRSNLREVISLYNKKRKYIEVDDKVIFQNLNTFKDIKWGNKHGNTSI